MGFKPDWKPRSGTRAGSTPPADAGDAGAGGAGAGGAGAGGAGAEAAGAGAGVPSAIAFC